jgi:hypothetical protein
VTEDENVQMPAARLTDRHVDDAITASEKAECRRQRAQSRHVLFGRFGRAARWIGGRLKWFVANAKDILGSLALVTAMMAVAESAGWIDLAAVPQWVQSLVTAMREVFS